MTCVENVLKTWGLAAFIEPSGAAASRRSKYGLKNTFDASSQHLSFVLAYVQAIYGRSVIHISSKSRTLSAPNSRISSAPHLRGRTGPYAHFNLCVRRSPRPLHSRLPSYRSSFWVHHELERIRKGRCEGMLTLSNSYGPTVLLESSRLLKRSNRGLTLYDPLCATRRSSAVAHPWD